MGEYYDFSNVDHGAFVTPELTVEDVVVLANMVKEIVSSGLVLPEELEKFINIYDRLFSAIQPLGEILIDDQNSEETE